MKTRTTQWSCSVRMKAVKDQRKKRHWSPGQSSTSIKQVRKGQEKGERKRKALAGWVLPYKELEGRVVVFNYNKSFCQKLSIAQSLILIFTT